MRRTLLLFTFLCLILFLTPIDASIITRRRIEHRLQEDGMTGNAGMNPDAGSPTVEVISPTSGPTSSDTDTDTDYDSDNTPTTTPTDAPTGASGTEAPVTTTEAPTEAATEAPATEAPATEAPTDAPATEAPATEAPATEAPATEAPATEAPATEAPATEAPTDAPATEAPATEAPTDAPATEAPGGSSTQAPEATDAPTSTPTGGAGTNDEFPGPNSNPDVCPQVNHTSSISNNTITFNANSAKVLEFVDVHITATRMFLNYRMTAGAGGVYTCDLPDYVSGDVSYWFTYVTDVDGTARGCDTPDVTGNVAGGDGPGTGFGNAPAQSGDEGTVCYQEIVGSSGTYAQVNAAFEAWAAKAYTALGLTGERDVSIGWAQVPDRNSFENGCDGPYATVADLFVHIDSNSLTDDYVTLSNKLEAFIAANPLTSNSTISCSARSVVSEIPICGVGISGNPSNPSCPLLEFDYNAGQETTNGVEGLAIRFDLPDTVNGTFNYVDVHVKNGEATFNYRLNAAGTGSYLYAVPISNFNLDTSRAVSYYFTYAVNGVQCDSAEYTYTIANNPTPAPTTVAPTTAAPTTAAPTTAAPTTEAPTTAAPTTAAPTTEAPTTAAPTTEAPTTAAPTTEAPTTAAPTTEAPTTAAPTTEAPTTAAPTTEAPTTAAPTTAAPTCETIQWCIAGSCTNLYPLDAAAVSTKWVCVNRVCTKEETVLV